MEVTLVYDHYHTFRCRDCRRQFSVTRTRIDPYEVYRCTHCDSPDTYPYHSLFKRIRHFMMMYELA
jgi:DNA-directed RNA polymerase subunit RPC12/RpoP